MFEFVAHKFLSVRVKLSKKWFMSQPIYFIGPNHSILVKIEDGFLGFISDIETYGE